MELTDWRLLITDAMRAQPARDYEALPVWHPSASEQAVAEVEEALGRALPADLKAALAVSNGVGERMRWPDRLLDTGCLLWSAEQIKERNLALRSDPLLQGRLDAADVLFFADNGCGDSYGFTLGADGTYGGPIVVHDHETDDLWQFAPSLREFIHALHGASGVGTLWRRHRGYGND